MDDLERYIAKRKKRSPEFAEGFEVGFEQFKLGVMLRIARMEAGLTQEQVAKRLKTKKSAISRIEKHAENARLLTIGRYARAVGKQLSLRIA